MSSENKNTLVILTPGFASSEEDSVCLPMHQSLIKNINKNYPGLDIVILAFQYPYFSGTYKWFGTTVISFNGQNKGGLSRLLLRRKIMAALRTISRDKNMIGVLSFWYGECAAMGQKFSFENNTRHCCWILGQDARKGNKYAKNVKLKATELIALSDFIQDEFEKNYDVRPLQVIPPGVDAGTADQLTNEKDIDIIAAGSLIALKQYAIFVKLIAELKKQMPAIKAVLIGDGPERNELQKLIDKHELNTNLVFAGELPHPGVLQYMRRGKIFLHPSSYEGFGVVCLEALAAGCEVISFCKPMKQDIEHWHIVSNPEEMKQKALELLSDKEIHFKSTIPFSINETAKKIMGLFGY